MPRGAVRCTLFLCLRAHVTLCNMHLCVHGCKEIIGTETNSMSGGCMTQAGRSVKRKTGPVQVGLAFRKLVAREAKKHEVSRRSIVEDALRALYGEPAEDERGARGNKGNRS